MSAPPDVTLWDIFRRLWDRARHTCVGSRYSVLVAATLSFVGFQTPTETICLVEGEVRLTSVVGLREADRLLEETPAYRGPCARLGPPAVLGEVTVRAYVQIEDDGTPYALGITFPDSAFASLPAEPADGYRCLDLNDDERIDIGVECVGGHERVLFLPRAWGDSVNSPFRWALFNWNPIGHGPAGVWNTAHFDFHFFVQSLADRSRIRIGRCAMLVDCDDLELGTRPVPPSYLPDGYEDRGVVEFGMGNHLIDPTTFGTPSNPPSHTLIYGAWAGHVSFLEPMITLDFLEHVRSRVEPSRCYEVPQAVAVEEAGHYPTEYCVRWNREQRAFFISLERFERRRAAGGGV